MSCTSGVTMNSYLGLSHSSTQNHLDLLPYVKKRRVFLKKNTLQSTERLRQKNKETNFQGMGFQATEVRSSFKKRLKRLNEIKV